jgi:hypothetical protein
MGQRYERYGGHEICCPHTMTAQTHSPLQFSHPKSEGGWGGWCLKAWSRSRHFWLPVGAFGGVERLVVLGLFRMIGAPKCSRKNSEKKGGGGGGSVYLLYLLFVTLVTLSSCLKHPLPLLNPSLRQDIWPCVGFTPAHRMERGL